MKQCHRLAALLCVLALLLGLLPPLRAPGGRDPHASGF